MLALRLALLAAAGILTSGCSPGGGDARPSAAGAALRAAAADGDTPAVRRLVADGAPIDSPDEDGRTALLEAVEADHLAAADVLLEAGASPNAQAANLDTPWLQAGALGRTEMLRRMLARGADLTVRNRYGGIAIIPASERGHVDTVAFLLTTGIDVNHVNDLGWTALLEAVILSDGGPDHQAIVRLLLAGGADPNLADREGVTALAHARARGQVATAALLEAAGARQ